MAHVGEVLRTAFVPSIAVMLCITFMGCHSGGPHFAPIAGGDAQDSTIYFYRPFSGTINSPSYEITELGAHIGMLREGGYFVLGAHPGLHHYAIRQVAGGVALYAESGKRYFVRLTSSEKRRVSGLATQNVFLELEDEQDAVRELRTYQPHALSEP
jgi:hypothetical protein